MVTVARLAVCFLALSLGACKTGRPEDPPTTGFDPNQPQPSDDPPPPESTEAVGAVTAAPRPAILSETLHPVRGGVRVLPAYHGQDPCKMALTGESPVAKACSEGGVRQAINLMQSFVKRARAQGIMFECIDCHADEDDRSQLTPMAESNFRKLLFLAHPD